MKSLVALHLIVILLLGTRITIQANVTTQLRGSVRASIEAKQQQQQQQQQHQRVPVAAAALTSATRTRGSVRFASSSSGASSSINNNGNTSNNNNNNNNNIHITSTTTAQPPSLRAPQRRPLATLPITAATTTQKTPTTTARAIIRSTTTTTTTTTTSATEATTRATLSKRRRQQLRMPASQSTTTPSLTFESALAHATLPAAATATDVITATTTTTTTTTTKTPKAAVTAADVSLPLRERTVRDISLDVGNEFGVRQNRSFQTRTANRLQRSDDSNISNRNNNNSNSNNVENHDDDGDDVVVVAAVDAHSSASGYYQQHSKRLQWRPTLKAMNSLIAPTAKATSKPTTMTERHREALSYPLQQLRTLHEQNAINDNTNNTNLLSSPSASSSSSSSSMPASALAPALASSSSSLQTQKTPRMIQRLVAGHIQNAQGHSTYEVSAVSSNSSVSNTSTTTTTTTTTASTTTATATTRATATTSATTSTTTVRPSSPTPLYFRLKQPILSSSYRRVRENATTPIAISNNGKGDDNGEHDNDDEALLDDPGDFDNWDNGILRLSAGSGKENAAAGKSKKSKKDDAASKKTLADQVRDGKYGLIEKELFRRGPKRPGVLSYLPNKEVPVDNEHNFGGLNEEDIWLAEDHLLVIKGGSLNDNDGNADSAPWPPIDDYDAPDRQIKLPAQPKVPPPFPVQLEENGPVQFIGNNKFTVVYPIANKSLSVYTGSVEANYAPPEGDHDHAKNIIARPGAPQDSAQNEPGDGYFYPTPYPPWLYHNQTFVNPYLKDTRPISFPGLGPFPFSRNGSLDNNNGTDDFDEDNPSLYYPPAYSFVYKSNYTNAVPPGPLVPGIVLPPPPNQFSRLEKHEKTVASSLPARHRVVSSTMTTSITTTSTMPPTTPSKVSQPSSTTTTPIPYRQVITKISEYIPKVITITPSPPALLSTGASIGKQTGKHAKPIAKPIEPVPVPVAVPIPIYPINYKPTSRQNIVAFVPTTTGSTPIDTLSQSNPIYYEYFEAKRQPAAGLKSNVIDEFLSTTVKPPPQPKPIKLYATSKRPFKQEGASGGGSEEPPIQQQQPPPQSIYLQPVQQQLPLPQRQFVSDKVVYITPKPPLQAPVFKKRPIDNFDREVHAIRETLRYYKNQQLRDNSIPRTPKAKTIYEYSFDGTKQLQPVTDAGTGFQPPKEFDEEPFKPMVTYSPGVNDENAFKAIAFDKADNEVVTNDREQLQQPQVVKYQQATSTTTLLPVPESPSSGYRNAHSGRSKKLRLGAKYLQQPLVSAYDQELPPGYGTTPRTVITTQLPWASIEAKDQQQQQHQHQHQLQLQQERHAERLQIVQPIVSSKHRSFQGYYYRQPSLQQSQPIQSIRQNNRFYEEPFQNPVRKIINYRPQLQQHAQQQPQQHQHQQQQWSLENDTYVNYAPNRPPLNPDAEFINPYQTLPVSVYAPQPQRLGPPPPAISHQSQYYPPPPLPPQQQQQPQPHPQQHQQSQHSYQHQRYPLRQLQQQQQQQIPQHRDIQVNYRPPLPPINPDSEYISHPHVVRNQGNQLYRTNTYRLASSGGVEQSNIYYITPKYRRASGAANSNSNPNANAAQAVNSGNTNHANPNEAEGYGK